MSRHIGLIGLRDLMNARIQAAGGVRKLAKRWGVSAAYISDLRRLQRLPGPRLQRKLGIRVTRITRLTVEKR